MAATVTEVSNSISRSDGLALNERPQDGDCATAQVLHTVELCEAMFLHLPLRTLIASVPLVCKQWHVIIEGSIKLQQKLFFKSTGPYQPKGRL